MLSLSLSPFGAIKHHGYGPKSLNDTRKCKWDSTNHIKLAPIWSLQCHKDYCQAYVLALKDPAQFMSEYIASHK